MDEITTVGIDLAKSIFQIHAIDASGRVAFSKAVRRSAFLPLLSRIRPCLVGMEACASSHHWARELTKLGHQVRLIPPSYVKAYVRRQKNDAADAAAICEAVSRPSMRFVPVKSCDQQAVLMLHRARALLVAQRTALVCALRAHMAEFGIVAPRGPRNIEPLLAMVADPRDERLPALARLALEPLARQMRMLQGEIERLDRSLLDWHRSFSLVRSARAS
jgi:transposase